MKQRNILLLYLLTVFIFLTKTMLFAQSKIAEKSEWFRPDYAKSNVDTVKVRYRGAKGNLPFSQEIITAYNKHGYITYYESAYFGQNSSKNPYSIESNAPVRRIWQRSIFFSYDEKNRLINIAIRNNDTDSEGNLGISIHHLKKHGGSLPNYYEKAIKEKIYGRFRMRIYSISFTYDASGNPANQIIQFGVERPETIIEGGRAYTRTNEIVGEGKKSVRDTLIFPNHDLVFKHKNEYMNQNYFYDLRKYFSNYKKPREKKYLNCNNIDLNDKWLWHRNLEATMCPDTAAIYGNMKFRDKQFPMISFYNQSGKLILRNTTHYYSSEPKPKFNCADVNKTAVIRHYNYNPKDQLQSETSYLIYKLLPGSKYPLPFCAENQQVMQSLPDQHFLVEHEKTTYLYYPNGLLKQEEHDAYNYADSERSYFCNRPCQPLNKQYVHTLLTNYSYTFHPNR